MSYTKRIWHTQYGQAPGSARMRHAGQEAVAAYARPRRSGEGASGVPAEEPEALEPAQPQHGALQLPPGLDLLWGRRERGKRGPRPGLTADAIVEAGIRVADTEGLEAVSMARVAK